MYDSIYNINSGTKPMCVAYSNQSTQMWWHGGDPHAPPVGELVDFHTQGVRFFPLPFIIHLIKNFT